MSKPRRESGHEHRDLQALRIPMAGGHARCQGRPGDRVGTPAHRRRRPIPRGPADYFDFDVAIEPPLLRLRLYGELDLATAPALDLVHCVLPDDIEVLELDLAGLRFCDTAGLRSLARLCTGASQRHRVQVVGVPPRLRKVVEITGLGRRWLAAG